MTAVVMRKEEQVRVQRGEIGRVRCRGMKVSLMFQSDFQVRTRGARLFFRIEHELVAEAAHGEQVTRFGGVALDVAAEANDEIVDGARVGVFVEIPDVMQNCLARDGFAGAADEVAKEFGFHEGELNRLFADLELERLKVESFAVEREFFVSRRGGRCRGAAIAASRAVAEVGSDDDWCQFLRRSRLSRRASRIARLKGLGR